MTVNIREIPAEDFEQKLFEFITQEEGLPFSEIGADPVGIPTLAYGYALFVESGGTYVRRESDDIRTNLASVGVTFTDSQWNSVISALDQMLDYFLDQTGAGVSGDDLQAAMNDYINSHPATQPGGALDFILSEQQNHDLTMLLVNQSKDKMIEGTGDFFTGSFGSSHELIALTSLHYNYPLNIGDGLRAALANPDQIEARVQAWMEIRYRSNGNRYDDDIAGGIQNRRDRESDMFGLFGSTTGGVDGYSTMEEQVAAAQQVLDTVRRNIDRVFSVDDPAGNGIDYVTDILDETRDARLLLFTELVASRLPAGVLGPIDLTSIDDYVQLVTLGGLEENVLSRMYQAHLDDGSQFVFENDLIVVGQNAINALSGSGNDIVIGSESTKDVFGGRGNDILLGENGTWLFGETGDDTLLGGGDNLLAGGIGYDTYVYDSTTVTAGVDVLDSDGQGRIIYNGVELSAATFVSSGLWVDAAGNTFEYNGSSLLINGRVLVPNYDRTSGSLGITLTGDAPEPTRNAIYGTEGDDRAETTATMSESRASLARVETSALLVDGSLEGDAADNAIYGLGGNDDIYGNGGSDLLDGGDGDDAIVDGINNDILIGGQGSDILAASGGSDQLSGGTEDDFLQGGGDDDVLTGGAGIDALNGGAGKDRLEGGSGNDILLGDATWVPVDRNYQFEIIDSELIHSNMVGGYDPTVGDSDSIIGGAGDDYIAAGGGNDYIVGGPEATAVTDNDQISGDAGDDRIFGGAGDDTLSGDNNSDYSIIGSDYLDGGIGNDALDGGTGSDVIFGGAGDDYLYGDGLDEPLNAGADVINGGEGNDQIFAGYGDDLVIAGSGNDLIYGGYGNDEVRAGDGDDEIDAGAGDDEILTGDGLNSVIAGEGADTVRGGVLRDLIEGNGGQDVLHGNGGNDQLSGGDDVDHLWGGEGDDLLVGGAGNDVLFGEGGNDELQGGLGNDQLTGGIGNDRLFAIAGDNQLAGDEGADELYGADGIDHITGGSGDDLLLGGAHNDEMYGGAGFDQLQGGVGDDRMNGDADNDILIGESGADIISGGSGDDELQGWEGNDTLNGDSGSDLIFGDQGNDTLSSGAGNDTLIGGAGDDTYLFNIGDGYDRIEEQSDTLNDQVLFGEGISSSEVSLAKRGDSLVLLVGNGEDQLELGNWFNTSGQQHVAQVSFSDGTVWDRAYLNNVEITQFIGTNGDDAVYGSAMSDNLFGYAGNDALNADSGNDVLDGGSGGDTLSGGYGNDVLNGGTGDDILHGLFDTDTHLFSVGDGNDVVLNAGLYNASAGYNVFQFDGTVTASDLSFLRTGNDLLISYGENSSIRVAQWFEGQDRVSFVFADGSSAPSASEINDLAQNISQDFVFGLGDGELVIEDWGGSDSITFGTGVLPADVQASRDGGDLVLTLSSGTDRVVMLGWFDGTYHQVEHIGFTDTSESLDVSAITQALLTLEGTDGNDYLEGGDAYSETLRGNAGIDSLYGYGADDYLDGGSGNDSLHGGIGFDTLNGGAGDDYLRGGEGHDTYLIAAGDDNDVIIDGSGRDIVRLGAELRLADSTFTNVGNDRIITFTSGQQIRLSGQNNGGGIDGVEFQTYGTELADTLTGSNTTLAVDGLHGLGGDDTINAGDGEDSLFGGDGNDILDSGAGIDWLYGEAGNDVLGGAYQSEDYYGDTNFYVGGAGDDTLNGTQASDVYIYNFGDGHDRIIERSGNDVLRFGPGVTPDDITFERVSSDMLIHVSDGGTIIVENWFTAVAYTVNSFEFTTDTGIEVVWEREDATRMALTVEGTLSDDMMTGTDGFSDTLFGMGGSDVLYGLGGSDRLDGGVGDDLLVGGYGNDEFYFDRGYGRDVVSDGSGTDRIIFGEGVSASDIEIVRSGDDIVLRISDTGDELVVESAMLDTGYHIEQIEFSDGGTLPSMPELVEQLITIEGTVADDSLTGTDGIDIIIGNEGNDTLIGLGGDDELYGGFGNDVLSEGAGADVMYGGAGNDTYILDATNSNGSEFIHDLDGVTTLQFSSGITPESLDLRVYWDDSDAMLQIDFGPDGKRMNVPKGYTDGDLRFEFSDGRVFTLDELAGVVSAAGGDINHSSDDTNVQMTGTAGADYIAGGAADQVISGGAGNDVLWGVGGNDLLFADEGSDEVNGGFGSDTLQGGLGDDVLIGSFDNDVLAGGAGSDVLDGGAGDDTYVLDRGYGSDVIVNETVTSGVITIQFGEGVAADDVAISDDGKDRVYTITDTGDSLRVQNFTSKGNDLNVVLQFADGTPMMASGEDGGQASRFVDAISIEPPLIPSASHVLSSDLDKQVMRLLQAEAGFGVGSSSMPETWHYQRQSADEHTNPLGVSVISRSVEYSAI